MHKASVRRRGRDSPQLSCVKGIMTHSVKERKLIVFIKMRKKSNGDKRCVWTKVGSRSLWLAGGSAGASWLSSQLGLDLVRELPQVGDSLAQIGKLSVDSADVCGRCEGDHHTEFLERRFHGCSFDKMALVTAPAVEGMLALLSALLAVVIALLGRGWGPRPLY